MDKNLTSYLLIKSYKKPAPKEPPQKTSAPPQKPANMSFSSRYSTASKTSKASKASKKLRPQTTVSAKEINIYNSYENLNYRQRSKSASSQLLRYEPPLVSSRRPKSLTGPYHIDDIPQIRGALNSYRTNNVNRKKHFQNVTREVYNDLNLNSYFANKSNWQDQSKFLSTSSFFQAVQVYFPAKNSRATVASARYREMYNRNKPSTNTSNVKFLPQLKRK